MAILRIAQDGHFIVIEINFINEHINQPLPVFRIIDIPFAELVQEETNFLCGGDRMLGGFYQELIAEFFVLFLLLRNAFSDNLNCLTTFQGLQQIFRSRLVFLNQFLKPFCVIVVTFFFAEADHFFRGCRQ